MALSDPKMGPWGGGVYSHHPQHQQHPDWNIDSWCDQIPPVDGSYSARRGLPLHEGGGYLSGSADWDNRSYASCGSADNSLMSTVSDHRRRRRRSVNGSLTEANPFLSRPSPSSATSFSRHHQHHPHHPHHPHDSGSASVSTVSLKSHKPAPPNRSRSYSGSIEKEMLSVYDRHHNVHQGQMLPPLTDSCANYPVTSCIGEVQGPPYDGSKRRRGWKKSHHAWNGHTGGGPPFVSNPIRTLKATAVFFILILSLISMSTIVYRVSSDLLQRTSLSGGIPPTYTTANSNTLGHRRTQPPGVGDSNAPGAKTKEFSSGRSIGGVRTSDPQAKRNRETVRKALHSTAASSMVPNDRWPSSVRDEEDRFEIINHPADTNVKLSVPRFYLSETGVKLGGKDGIPLTRDITSMIGRYHSPSSSTLTGGYRFGRKSTNTAFHDVNARTIYVSIVSFRDWRCRLTVESLFGNARHPDRIRVGVVDQLIPNVDKSCDMPMKPCELQPEQALCRYHHLIDVYEMESKVSVGPTFARHVSQRMYRGEYYVLQVDSHTTFLPDWDVDLVADFENLGNEMGVISTYMSEAQDESGIGERRRYSRRMICNAVYSGVGTERRLRHEFADQPETISAIQGIPELHPYWSSSFSFSRGHFLLVVPYDPHLPMVDTPDEEISMAVRGFTHGYDFYAPSKSICYHTDYYAEGGGSSIDAERLRQTDFERASIYTGMRMQSLSRLKGIIGMSAKSEVDKWNHVEEDTYGTGEVREATQFFTSFGIHVENMITEKGLCDFVTSGRMHRDFHDRYLREDGMGIDYSEIKFRYHELMKIHDG